VGGPKAYQWEASVDTPAASAFRQDCVRQNRDQRLQRGQGADAQSAPCSAHERSRRREQQGGKSLGPKWAASNGLWCQSGLAKIFIGPKVVHTGQAIAGRPYPATPIWRIQLWGEMAMKWSQAMCASTSSICCRCRPGPIRARAGTCLVSPWNRRSGRAFSRRTGGFPQSPSQPGPQSRKLMCHEAPDAAGAYGSISIFRA
jgi:hypothetical protein